MQLPEIIAEIGVNYFEIASRFSLELVDAAKMMVAEAKAAGATAVKFQIYKAEKLAAHDSPAYWDLNEESTGSQRELFSRYDKLPVEQYKVISDYCSEISVEFMATAFDMESASRINPLVKRHKIASADITNIELLSHVGSFGKPVILSTGASTRGEIATALDILQQAGTSDITLMHCVLNYPTLPEKANLWRIGALKREFPELPVGYSDHTRFNRDILYSAWLLGAEVIEKHFTLDKSLKGNDHYHAATPDDIKELVAHLRSLNTAVGDETAQLFDASEEISRKNARRGVYLARDVCSGDPMKAEDVIFLRPQSDGITPIEWSERLSRQERYLSDVKSGQLIR